MQIFLLRFHPFSSSSADDGTIWCIKGSGANLENRGKRAEWPKLLCSTTVWSTASLQILHVHCVRRQSTYASTCVPQYPVERGWKKSSGCC